MPTPPWYRDVAAAGRRRRRQGPSIILEDNGYSDEEITTGGDSDDDESSRQLRVMAINHLTALVLIFYGLYALCRFGFGWDPARDPPPPTYTLHIKGLTDDTAAGSTGTVSWNLRGSYANESH